MQSTIHSLRPTPKEDGNAGLRTDGTMAMMTNTAVTGIMFSTSFGPKLHHTILVVAPGTLQCYYPSTFLDEPNGQGMIPTALPGQ